MDRCEPAPPSVIPLRSMISGSVFPPKEGAFLASELPLLPPAALTGLWSADPLVVPQIEV